MIEEYITMSTKEISRLEVFEKVSSKRLTKVAAAKLLGLSKRHVIRLFKRYKKYGAKGLVSQRRGKASNNKLPEPLKEACLAHIKERYEDFGPTLACEKLQEEHELSLSVESCRQLMLKAGLWKGKKRKAFEPHQMRQRRSAFGELVQIDGSPHRWFEDRGPKCTLLVFIDDATGSLMQLHFEEEESMQGYMDAGRAYFLKHGKPIAWYSDRHGIFRVNAKEAKTGSGETQFGRAMRELDIDLIHANSPQAKGRVERVNATLQDRLVKELRLKGISDMAAANAYLPEYIEKHNARFAVAPALPVDAHRKLGLDEPSLDLILCQRYDRKISKNLEVHYKNKIYQIQSTTQSYTMRGGNVEVRDKQGSITLIYKNKVLSYKVFHKEQRILPVATSKQVNSRVEQAIGRKPKKDHPWLHQVIINKGKGHWGMGLSIRDA